MFFFRFTHGPHGIYLLLLHCVSIQTVPLYYLQYLRFLLTDFNNFYRASARIACRVRCCFTVSVRMSVRPSVCLSARMSVQCWYCVQTNAHRHTCFTYHYRFLSRTAVTKFQGEAPRGSVNGKGKGTYTCYSASS